ncbi:hypothetical protein SAY87_007611 [Trapa incisa]|uniref:Uncharacterized protein n=1 Tax=Trapa incisa TaxID=236973 RepID=A0AAN7KEP6_9MYRT|nr:hypothetical protein SAY87_007611 [Trapa incisa]
MPMLRKKLSLKKLARKLKSGGSDGGIHVRQKLLHEEEEKDELQAAAIRPEFVPVYVGRSHGGSWSRQGRCHIHCSGCCWRRPTRSSDSVRGAASWFPAASSLSRRP